MKVPDIEDKPQETEEDDENITDEAERVDEGLQYGQYHSAIPTVTCSSSSCCRICQDNGETNGMCVLPNCKTIINIVYRQRFHSAPPPPPPSIPPLNPPALHPSR